ncbi:hypothetical protein [Polyangium spumosum]|uniref:Uncharacterized protein n=1 Tax=Polyangium spumosum TaxID=889282 RepID=A0A6N7PQC4_9BACT|nr:hypothetical protein [Polyangium spumosum]MRG94268.1 hypothetical protein [Polyangium spumosum]
MGVRNIVTGIITVASLSLIAAGANAATLAYCTGNARWVYDQANLDVACSVVLRSTINAKKSVTRAQWGKFKTGSRNNANLICDQGTKPVVGTGKSVFENGRNMATQLGWKNCVLKIL